MGNLLALGGCNEKTHPPQVYTMNGKNGVEGLLKLLSAVEGYDINSIRKLRMFIWFAENQGASMSELAGGTRTTRYAQVQQAVIELSSGRFNARVAPNLVKLGQARTEKPGPDRKKPIQLTARGKRLWRKIEKACNEQ